MKHQTLLFVSGYLSACFAIAAPGAARSQSPNQSELFWIWGAKPAADRDAYSFRKEFEWSGEVKSAKLEFTVDNGGKAMLNGKNCGVNSDWNSPTITDSPKKHLVQGKNVLVIEAANHGGTAAMVARLTITAMDGTKTVIGTDTTWQAALPGRDEWKPAVVMAKYGEGPWKDALSAGGGADAATQEVVVPEGFKAQLIYTVPKAEQGSWVSMTHDGKGNLLLGDQYGAIYRLTPPPPDSEAEPKVERLETSLVGAHGLLWAFDSLYVMVNESPKKGLWRLTDKNGDGKFEGDEEKHLRFMDGGGEHGPHSVVLGPDGKSLYVVCGNHTKLPEQMEISRGPRAWGEDHIVERLWDANGHARGILAPGGYICKTDPNGEKFELFSHGFRNQFDVAFNDLGDAFTFDADMEWDVGSPWYRPCRINLCVSGAEFGWRSGAGKWPAYYPDSLPAVLDIGPGSPTGLCNGLGAKFPAKYQRAIYAADWTYGTMYAIHLTPDGAGYKAEREEFVSGRPLPLTDMLILPQDGAMYFAVGGRRTQSAVYRVSYEGKESTAKAATPELTAPHRLRRELERLHEEGTGPEAVDKAWSHLGSEDRWIRWAARIAIERQPVANWAQRALGEQNAQAALEAGVALARLGAKDHRDALLTKLNEMDFVQLSLDQQLSLVRIYQLAVIRGGKPEGDLLKATVARIDALFPSKQASLNRELSGLLVALGSGSVVAKTIALMGASADDFEADGSDSLLSRNSGYAAAFRAAANSRPNRQQIAYAYNLRMATVGWTPELRRTFFSWFPATGRWSGGNSFKGFIENIRKDALANSGAQGSELKELDEMSAKRESGPVANIRPAKGPGKNYTIDEILALTKDGLKGRDFENGKAMFTTTMCSLCHRFNGEGGSIGPDLTGSGARYTMRDLLENIIEPSKVVSDQYESIEITKNDGTTVVGRIMSKDAQNLHVALNPFAPSVTVPIPVAEVASQKPSPISMMAPGLINILNEDELQDLLAYILAGGNPDDARFKK